MKDHPEKDKTILYDVDFVLFEPQQLLILPDAKEAFQEEVGEYAWALHQNGFLISERHPECRSMKYVIDFSDPETLSWFNRFHLFTRNKLTLAEERKFMLRLHELDDESSQETLKFDNTTSDFYLESIKRSWDAALKDQGELSQEIERITRSL